MSELPAWRQTKTTPRGCTIIHVKMLLLEDMDGVNTFLGSSILIFHVTALKKPLLSIVDEGFSTVFVFINLTASNTDEFLSFCLWLLGKNKKKHIQFHLTCMTAFFFSRIFSCGSLTQGLQAKCPPCSTLEALLHLTNHSGECQCSLWAVKMPAGIEIKVC